MRHGARRAPKFTGRIEFDNVSFGYGPDKPIINDVSLKIGPGQVAAFVGPSGAGKTTIVSLIPRFYDPLSRGEVVIQGSGRSQDHQLKSLRDQMSFVLQDTVLFRATILAKTPSPMASPEATSAEEIRRAAELAKRERVHLDAMPELATTRWWSRLSERTASRCQAASASASRSPAP